MNAHTILIGACGWQYPQWDETYYPEGIPEDWRLAYYGNEYPVVLVPVAYWTQGMPAIESWLQESDHSPRFVCEWPASWDGPAQAEVQAMVATLGERVAAILVPLSMRPEAAGLRRIEQLLDAYPVCLDWQAADRQGLLTWLAQSALAGRVSLCWHGEAATSADLDVGRVALARVRCEAQTPRSLRSLLEGMLAHTGEREGILLFDGQPPDLEIVDQAQLILNLL